MSIQPESELEAIEQGKLRARLFSLFGRARLFAYEVIHPFCQCCFNLLRGASAHPFFTLQMTIFVALIALLSAVIVIQRAAPMRVEAITEIWSVLIPEGAPMPHYLSGLHVVPSRYTKYCGNTKPGLVATIDLPNVASLHLHATFVSIDAQNLSVILRPENKNRTYGRIRCGEVQTELNRSVILRVPVDKSRRLTFTVEGYVTIGSLPKGKGGKLGPPLLLSGEVIASARSFPFETGRVEVRSRLAPGDELQLFDAPKGDSPAFSEVIARYRPDTSAYQVTLHSNAARAEIFRLGNDFSYPIASAPSLWARIEAQAEWAVLIAMLAVILNAASAIRHHILLKKLDIDRAKVIAETSPDF